MFIVNWAYNALGYLGLWSKDAKILFLGLDNAGKTTMLQMLSTGQLGSHQPTANPNCAELTVGKLRLQAHDLGGHKSARRLWNDYMVGVDAVVYMVDAYDRERLAEAKEALQGIMSVESMANVPIVVFGNKIDLPHAASEDELRYALSIDTTGKGGGSTGGQRPIEIFPCSVVKKFGYGKGLEWLSEYIK